MRGLLLLFCILLTSVDVIADYYYMIPQWENATEREDGKSFSKDEVQHFTSYNADCNTGVVIDVRTKKILPVFRKQFIRSDKPEICLRYTVTDLKGLTSKLSELFVLRDYKTPKPVECIPKETNFIVDKAIPNTVSNFEVTQIADTSDYIFRYVDPTTYNNGKLLPDGAVVKRYIFGNNKWIKDIKTIETSFVLSLTPGGYVFEMEVETLVDGVRLASNRSDKVYITVE